MSNTLDQFTTFWQSTGPTYMRGLKDLINEEQKHTYTMPRLQKAHDMEDMIQGGSSIKDRIFFDVQSTYARIDANHQFTYDNKQTGTDWETFWSIAAGYVVWNKWERSLNFDSADYTDSALTHKFKDVMRQKMQNMYTDYCNSREDELWAVPDKSKMEVSQGNASAPMSIPAFINEFQNGLPNGSDQPGGTWTTVQGLAPATYTKWRPPQVGYTYNAASDNSGIFSSFMGMWHSLRWDRLPKHAEYGEKTTSPHFIGCSLQGVLNYENALRLNQDFFRGRGKESGQDPAYDGPTFMGLPIDRISNLETAAIYPTAASDALSTELDTSNTPSGAPYANDGSTSVGYAGPRYYFVNGEYLRPTYHSADYFEMTDIIKPPDKPFDRIQVYSTTNQLVCRSRRRCGGIVFPTADTTDIAVPIAE